MTEFTIALAGRLISISAMYPSARVFCKEYLAEGTADFHVSITPEDIAYEREKSAREDELEGLPVHHYPDAYLETLAIYRKIAEKLLDYDTLLFHGSTVSVDGEGYLFTAKSGTGKSTHTRLWREAFGERVMMVNDDKPLLRITEDGVLAYGTPWDGKHHLSTNVMVPLKAICILNRARENHIEPLNVSGALSTLLQQSYRPRDPMAMAKTLELLDKMTKKVGIYNLGCNMEPEAALVAYNGMNRKDR